MSSGFRVQRAGFGASWGVQGFLLLAALVGSACNDGSTAPGGNGPDTTTTPSKAIQVVFPAGTVRAELATLASQRTTGLMNRVSIAADSGMIFVWAADQQNFQSSGFWMLNTHFDLDVAFLDANKRVINIESMTKETTTTHHATAPYRYALEAPRGWFAAHQVGAGTTAIFTIPAGVIIDP